MTEHLIKPDGAIIRSIDIHYYIYSDGRNMLFGLRFCDKDANTLLQCGVFCAPNGRFINHTMVVNEDERIVGVRSKISNGTKVGSISRNWAGFHFDIEFLLLKMKRAD